MNKRITRMIGVLTITLFALSMFVAMTNGLALAASPLFADSFESKNFASWTGTRTTAGETSSVTNQKANDGVYSAFFSADGNQTSGYAYAYKNLQPQTILYERGYILPATFAVSASYSRFYFAAFAGSKGDTTVMAGCINSGSKISWRLAVRVGTSWSIVDSSTVVSLNEWHAFELQWIQSSTGGYGKLYIDNTLVCSVSQVNTSSYGNVTMAECGIVMSGNAKTNLYLDYIQISNVPFGTPNPPPDPPNYYKGFIVSPSTMNNPDQKGSNFGYSDLQQMKTWGATAVRIHDVYGYRIMPTKGTFDLSFFQKYLDVYAQACKQLGLYCIIDLGDLQWSSYFGSGYGMPSWFYQGKYPASSSYRNIAARDFWDLNNPLQAENRQWFIKWWQFIADRYKNNTWVMFSIYNEPLNPGISACANESEVQRLNVCYSRFMEQVYDAIRATGAVNQTVIVNQPWAHSLKEIVRVNRTVTWDFHMYVGQTFSITQWTNSFIQERNRYVNDFKQPCLMGEMGIYPDSASVYDALNYQAVLKSEVSALKSYGASGWFFLDWGALAGECNNQLTAAQTNNIANALFA